MKVLLLSVLGLYCFTAAAQEKLEVADPDFSYTTDSWFVKDQDYGTITINRIDYGEPVVAPYALSASVGCADPAEYEKNNRKPIFNELTICSFEGHKYNKQTHELRLDYKPLLAQQGSKKCGPKIQTVLKLQNFCKQYREPSSIKKK